MATSSQLPPNSPFDGYFERYLTLPSCGTKWDGKVKYCALLKLYRDSHHASTKLARRHRGVPKT
jgi:hypothetical protein